MSAVSSTVASSPGTIIGVVLAGGASRRMGQDKARLELGGTSLVAQAADKLSQVARDVLVADRGRRLVRGYRSITDGAGGGPAAGILGAARVFPGEGLLVLACDIPAAPVALLERLADAGDPEDDALVPRWSRGIEPLCACYRPAALAALDERVRDGRFALHELLAEDRLNVRILTGRELAAFGPPERIFLNLNTPTDLNRLVT